MALSTGRPVTELLWLLALVHERLDAGIGENGSAGVRRCRRAPPATLSRALDCSPIACAILIRVRSARTAHDFVPCISVRPPRVAAKIELSALLFAAREGREPSHSVPSLGTGSYNLATQKKIVPRTDARGDQLCAPRFFSTVLQTQRGAPLARGS